MGIIYYEGKYVCCNFIVFCCFNNNRIPSWGVKNFCNIHDAIFVTDTTADTNALGDSDFGSIGCFVYEI